MPLYLALEYMMMVVFYGIAGNWLKGANEILSAAATLTAALLAGGVLLTSVDRRPFGALGFRWTKQSPREVGAGYAIGGGAMLACVLFLIVIRALSYRSDTGTAATWLQHILFDFAVFAIAAAAEEAVFRGYAFQALVRGFGAVTATVGTAALFAYAHMENPNMTPFALINIFLAGVLLGMAYLKTMSLIFATAVHAGWNWVMASLLDLPVSGLNMFQTPLYEPVDKGVKWVSGGTFGPEGGIAGTIGLLIALYALFYLFKLRVAPEIAVLRPIALAENIQESA